MNPLNPEDLQGKIDHVLETMCFVIADPLEEGASDAPMEEEHTSAWIEFHTDTEEGRLELSADEEFLNEAASGLLGVEPDGIDPPADLTETLLELANIIGGEIVALLGGDDHTYKMGLPSSDPLTLDGPVEETNLGFDSMGSLLHVRVKRRHTAA